MEYNDKEIMNIFFTLNIDILNYKDVNNNQTILHKLVQKRKTGVIINLIKIFNKQLKYINLQNRFIIDYIENQNFEKTLKEYIMI